MKIAICTPHHSHIHAQYSISLMGLIAHTNASSIIFNGVPAQVQLQVFMASGSLLPYTRNRLLRDAYDWKADFLLWLDSDHIFPADTLIRLLSRNLRVVGANYPRRSLPARPTALSVDGFDLWTTKEKAEAGAVEEVSRLGLGVCLMNMTVLNDVLRVAKAEGRKTIWPMFSGEPVQDDLEGKGEDTFFFAKLRKAGIKTYVDHAVSWEVGHIHEIILWNADTEAQKAEYLRGSSTA